MSQPSGDGAPRARARAVRWLATLTLSVGLWALAGCAATPPLAGAQALDEGLGERLAYYWQSLRGHARLMSDARAIAEVRADPATPTALKERLALAQALRTYASHELALPDNASYTRWVDLHRSAVVWNVVAAPELSLELYRWCFPLAGCVSYRGYYDAAEAHALAARLRDLGWEVTVYGVPAYSTLGWLNWLGGDPIPSTLTSGSDTELARLMFHELAHQVVYVSDDTAFNESYATAVEGLALRQWLKAPERAHLRLAADAQERQRQAFRSLTRETRAQLSSAFDASGHPDQARAAKALVMADFRLRYARWRASPEGDARYDRWVAEANNAALGSQGSYDEWVGAFEALFQRVDGSWTRFHAAVRTLAALPADERHRQLKEWKSG